MARPDSISDIKHADRFTTVATFEIDKFIQNSTLLKHYTSLLEAINKSGGMAEKYYNTVKLQLPKDKQELEYQLASDQRTWDDMQEQYNLAVDRGPSSEDFPEWKRNNIISWAKRNELPDPFDVFAANDPELALIRADLNMEDDSE